MRRYFYYLLIVASFIFLLFVLPNRYYVVAVYSIMVLLPLWGILHTFYNQNRVKRGTIVDGVIVKRQKQDESELLDIDYIIEVEFFSPFDQRKYAVKGEEPFKSNDNCKVWFNEKSPDKSIPIREVNWRSVIFMFVLIVIFSFLLFREVYTRLL